MGYNILHISDATDLLLRYNAGLLAESWDLILIYFASHICDCPLAQTRFLSGILPIPVSVKQVAIAY